MFMELLYLTFWELRNLSFRGTPCVAIIAVKELVNIEQARSLRKQNNNVLESTDKTRDKAWEEKKGQQTHADIGAKLYRRYSIF